MKRVSVTEIIGIAIDGGEIGVEFFGEERV